MEQAEWCRNKTQQEGLNKIQCANTQYMMIKVVLEGLFVPSVLKALSVTFNIIDEQNVKTTSDHKWLCFADHILYASVLLSMQLYLSYLLICVDDNISAPLGHVNKTDH